MKVDVIILAGSPNEGALRQCSNAKVEALIPIGKKCMIEYVVEALRTTDQVGKIIVVGPRHELGRVLDGQVILTEGGQNLVGSLRHGLALLNSREPVLVVCADVPLLTGRAIEDFLKQCSTKKADLYYPIIRQEVVEAVFPNAKRTYVSLAEGVFTGGNIMLINPHIVSKCATIAEMAVQMRKKPFKLCQMLGFKMLMRFFMRKLSVAEIEKKVSEILQITGVAVVSEYPEIGVDVDKPGDLELVLACLDKTA